MHFFVTQEIEGSTIELARFETAIEAINFAGERAEAENGHDAEDDSITVLCDPGYEDQLTAGIYEYDPSGGVEIIEIDTSGSSCSI